MLRSSERIGAGIFDAASAPVRLQILRLLSTKGPMPYTEVMFQLKLDPVRDAGKFVYHLKSLTDTGLVTLDKKTKRYGVTELGLMIVSFARDLDEYVNVKRGKLYVRTSRLAIEEFHRNKIARSLVVEAGVPQEIADEIAAEAEDRLVRLKTVYLTAPLIREFVNAILIEKKLEEYRHKLARLGMPVYDVAKLVKVAGEKQLSADYVYRSSAKSVLSEYVILNCLPHKLSDAHLSGAIHIANLESWILTPNEIVHDLRYFMKSGVAGRPSPDSLESALGLVNQVLAAGAIEVSGEQTIDFFNIFLAPFAHGRKNEDITKTIYYFLSSLRRETPPSNPEAGVSIGIELFTPGFLANEDAIGPGTSRPGLYSDFVDESLQIAESTVEAFRLISTSTPPILPHLLVKIRPKSLENERVRRILIKAHALAVERSVPFFELLKDDEKSSYSATGLRLADEWTGRWDADCVRTGSMDTIFINLPRVAYEAKKNDEKFFSLLKESVALTVEGFKVKKKFMNERLHQPLLPILAGEMGRGPYFYEKNASYNISFLGLSEAVEVHTGLRIDRDRVACDLALKTLQETSKQLKAASEEEEMRIILSQRPGDEAGDRLAELDIEEYGRSAMSLDGSRVPVYYTDLPTIPLTTKAPLDSRINIEPKFQSLMPGGHLNVICISLDTKPDGLMKLTERALASNCKFLTYSSNYSVCNACNQTELGISPKCGRCGSDRLTYLGRSSYGILPFSLWPEAKRRAVERRVDYAVTT
ncbi:MAG TPA: anaerobic ribonucleoside-triphosphate reductase [Candidatus Acidoferrales bacterium]|nr:anaerobic ribonucleoside-triphosphate reductase [Candidatus Acidoferrales bacterium]